jgi:hypothetical protein
MSALTICHKKPVDEYPNITETSSVDLAQRNGHPSENNVRFRDRRTSHLLLLYATLHHGGCIHPAPHGGHVHTPSTILLLLLGELLGVELLHLLLLNIVEAGTLLMLLVLLEMLLLCVLRRLLEAGRVEAVWIAHRILDDWLVRVCEQRLWLLGEA